MNGIDTLISSFARGIDKIINTVGNWGSSQPVDDSKSGIKIDDKIYQVVVSLNGCYWYLDESGKKKSISQLPATTEWSWTNIQEKVLKDFKTCYRTPGGKVEVWSWFLLNDQMDVLKEQHRITDSTDIDNPTGTILESIPDNWRMIDCDLPDMTERDVTSVNRCYITENNKKINIEGLESIDDKNSVRESVYTVLITEDDMYPEGTELSLIPNTWTRMQCDFPDMTKRLVLNIDICFVTPDGKIHLNGYKIIDPIGGNRKEYYIVSETTDPNIERLSTFTSIPDNWSQIVCDFPDATTSDTEVVENCYKTQSGKVQLRTIITFDGYGGSRVSSNIVLKSTDPAYNIGASVVDIPVSWLNIECDFASATQRHVKDIMECYESSSGKVYVEGYRVVDNELSQDRMELTVVQSTDPSISSGTIWTSVPAGFVKTLCNCNCF